MCSIKIHNFPKKSTPVTLKERQVEVYQKEIGFADSSWLTKWWNPISVKFSVGYKSGMRETLLPSDDCQVFTLDTDAAFWRQNAFAAYDMPSTVTNSSQPGGNSYFCWYYEVFGTSVCGVCECVHTCERSPCNQYATCGHYRWYFSHAINSVQAPPNTQPQEIHPPTFLKC